jgi:hypothetical protein
MVRMLDKVEGLVGRKARESWSLAGRIMNLCDDSGSARLRSGIANGLQTRALDSAAPDRLRRVASPTVRDLHSWTDEDLEHFAREQAERHGLTFLVEARPRMSTDEPTIWFAALKQMNVPLAPDGVGVLGSEALSRRAAVIGLAQLLGTLSDSEREWLLRLRLD